MSAHQHLVWSRTPALHRGGCHCGAVRFEVELDAAARASTCTCAHCVKAGGYDAYVAERGFELLSGMDSLRDYGFGSRTVRHYFCGRCGVRTFCTAPADDGGEDYGIALACLDVTPEQTSEVDAWAKDAA